jgi:hypothetical protein
MSHPFWPQSRFGYRPRKWSYASQGYNGLGEGPRYGSLTSKVDWATPRYMRIEPDGLGDLGADTPTVAGCMQHLSEYLSYAVYMTLNTLTGGGFPDLILRWGRDAILRRIGRFEDKLFQELYAALLQNRAAFMSWLKTKILAPVQSEDMPDEFKSLPLEGIADGVYNMLIGELNKCLYPDAGAPITSMAVIASVSTPAGAVTSGNVNSVAKDITQAKATSTIATKYIVQQAQKSGAIVGPATATSPSAAAAGTATKALLVAGVAVLALKFLR